MNLKPSLKEIIVYFLIYLVFWGLALWSVVNIGLCIIYDVPYNWFPLLTLAILIPLVITFFVISIFRTMKEEERD